MQYRRSWTTRFVTFSVILLSILSGQILVRPTGFNLHFFEYNSIHEGRPASYLVNRLGYEWRSAMPAGSNDLLESKLGDVWFRKERMKFFPSLTTTFYPNGGHIKTEDPYVDIAPTVNLFANYRLLPMGRYGLVFWARVEKHSVVSQGKISNLSYDFSLQKELGRRNYQGTDSTWIEYSIADGGILLSYPKGEITFAKSNPIWGPGYTGQLLLSNRAPSFVFVNFRHQFSERWTFSFFHGSLNSTFRDSTHLELYPDTTGLPLIRKYVSGHRVDFVPLDGLHISVGESIIYGARGMEMAYTLPVLFYWSIEPDLSNSDNLQMFAEFQWVKKNLGRLYASIYIDEWDFVDTFNKQESRNWMAYQGGLSYLLPLFTEWHSLFRVEFTHLTPYVYVHESKISTFQHHGHYLGFWSGPNSDNIFVSVEGSPREDWWVQLYGQRARRGEVSDETIARQYNFEKIPFLYPFESNPETRILLGFRGELLLFSFLRLSFDIYHDQWMRQLDPQNGQRADSRKFDAMLQVSIGL